MNQWISSKPRSEDPIIRATAILAFEFGWQVDYIVFKLPLSYLNAYLELIQEKHEAETSAINGKGYVPKTEQSPERVDQKLALIRKNYSKVDEVYGDGSQRQNNPSG